MLFWKKSFSGRLARPSAWNGTQIAASPSLLAIAGSMRKLLMNGAP